MSLSAASVNQVGNLTSNYLAFLYGATSAVNAIYLNAGDYTPITLQSTAPGRPGSVYTVVAGVSASVVLVTGTLSAGNAIGVSGGPPPRQRRQGGRVPADPEGGHRAPQQPGAVERWDMNTSWGLGSPRGVCGGRGSSAHAHTGHDTAAGARAARMRKTHMTGIVLRLGI